MKSAGEAWREAHAKAVQAEKANPRGSGQPKADVLKLRALPMQSKSRTDQKIGLHPGENSGTLNVESEIETRHDSRER